MIDWLDTPGELAATLAVGGVIVSLLFYIIDSRLAKVQREFTPNGGSSMRDQLNRIEAKIDGHIAWHLEEK